MKDKLKDFLSSNAFLAFRNKDVPDTETFGAKDMLSSSFLGGARAIAGLPFGVANTFEVHEEIV
jgi:hypothetical protein